MMRKTIVVDPVMVATSGARLISEEAIDALKSCLLPMATVLTPNIPEAEVLAGMKSPVAGGYDKSSRRDRHQISLCSSL